MSNIRILPSANEFLLLIEIVEVKTLAAIVPVTEGTFLLEMQRFSVCRKLCGFEQNFVTIRTPSMSILVLEADLSRPTAFPFSGFRIKTLVQALVLLVGAAVHTFVQIFVLFGAETGFVFELGFLVLPGHLFATQ